MPLYQHSANQSTKNEKDRKFEKVFSLKIPACDFDSRNYTAATRSPDANYSSDELDSRSFSSVVSKSPVKHLKSGKF